MNNPLLAPCLAACALFALTACEDRRNTYPPDESRAATTDVQPAGVAGDASRPADAANPDGRCDHLEDQALRDCMQQVDEARNATDLVQ